MADLGLTVVTGGAGAIGSGLVRTLLTAGADSVIVIDDLSSGHPWLLPEDSRVKLFVRDVCDLPSLGLEISTPLVFHLAAFFANQNSVEHPLADLRTNGLGTLALLLWASERAARRVVYASAGCSIAGHNINEPIHEDLPVSLNLDTPYQITKVLGEFYCNYFADQISTVRCRFFNSYGPGELPGRYRNVIPNFIWNALRGQPLVITGTGDETRDFIYVDDLVEGLLRAGTMPDAHSMAFNLGTGAETRIGDLAEMIVKFCNSSSAVRFAPRRAWDKSTRRRANIEQAKRVLGFQPKIGIQEGLERTVAWFRRHWKKIEQSVLEVP